MAAQKALLVVIWMSMFIWIPAYVYLAWSHGGRGSAPASTVSLITMILGIGSAGQLVLAGILPRQIMKRIDARLRESVTSQEVSALARRTFAIMIVSMALIEAVAVYGLVLALMGAPSAIIPAVFFVAGAGGLVWFRSQVVPGVLTRLDQLAQHLVSA